MLRRHARLAPVHDDHWSTDSASIAGDKNGAMVVVDVHAHEFADATSPAKLPEVVYEAAWIASQADDRAIHIDDVGVRTIDFCSGRSADVCEHTGH